MKRFGLLGRSLGHSASAAYFNEKFRQEGRRDHHYQNFELPRISDFPALLQQYPDLRGLNVTIPYKQAVMPYLSQLSATAQAIGAVNTIVFQPRPCGYNTDAAGFWNSLAPHLQAHHRQALVLGTGGASRAVSYALRQKEIPHRCVSRSPQDDQLSYHAAAEALSDYPLLINATPMGTFPDTDTLPPLVLDGLGPAHLVVDLIYNPPQTALLKAAQQKGAAVLNGRPMLEAQAEAAWQLWQ
jgi:shikimate dehydrogenase